MRRSLTILSSLALVVAPLTFAASTFNAATAGASTFSCNSITKSFVVADGFSHAKKPKITPYNYKKLSKNSVNALGTTIDFGKNALIVGCVSPKDIAKLSKIAKSSTTMTAAQYMAYVVKQSAGSMTATKVGPITDYLDYGNGKEDGLGSLSKSGGLRLDAWVSGNYIFLTFSQPPSTTPSTALMNFITSVNTDFAG
jgi:hypothetical protein